MPNLANLENKKPHHDEASGRTNRKGVMSPSTLRGVASKCAPSG